MIFLSHNYKDKDLIEEIAKQLAYAFGQDKIFYDSWSIQPGDGIINKMNQGLEDCKYFFFFVSKNSLQSNMVKLEWQAALLKATKGNAKFVPVRIEDCTFPIIFMQTLYIDIFEQGLDVGIRQIVDVVNGNNTFRPNKPFQNVYAYLETGIDFIIIEFKPRFYMEPISKYTIILDNDENDISWEVPSDSMFIGGINKGMFFMNGKPLNALYIGVDRATTPTYSVIVKVKQKTLKPIKLIQVMKGKNNQVASFEVLPLIDK